MRRFVTIVFLFSALACSRNLFAQTVTDTYESVDTVIFIPVNVVDSTLVGKDIFDLVSEVRQPQLVQESMNSQIKTNGERAVSGYRIRIFFDNKQSARSESEATLIKFKSLFPDIMAYRIYVNPYFKVTVGDFRTKSEAMALLSKIKGAFPSAFVVKENIGYPSCENQDSDN